MIKEAFEIGGRFLPPTDDPSLVSLPVPSQPGTSSVLIHCHCGGLLRRTTSPKVSLQCVGPCAMEPDFTWLVEEMRQANESQKACQAAVLEWAARIKELVAAMAPFIQ